jgi:hypothetical protein
MMIEIIIFDSFFLFLNYILSYFRRYTISGKCPESLSLKKEEEFQHAITEVSVTSIRRASQDRDDGGNRRLSSSSDRRSSIPSRNPHLPAWVFETDNYTDRRRNETTKSQGISSTEEIESGIEKSASLRRYDSFTISDTSDQPDW